MADYMVGRGSKNKDRYQVGWNKTAENSKAYKVGGNPTSVGQSENKTLGGGDQASPAGSKSAFSYSEMNTSDVGDQSPNMNVGGSVSDGVMADPTQDGGQVELNYAEKGDWSTSKEAIARRKANADAAKRYYSQNAEYGSPTDDIISVKKP